MPHIDTGGGAEADALRFIQNPGASVAPIVGNTGQGGAAYDASTGEAVYGVYHDGAFRCFRTTAGANSLALVDDSVVEVGMIWNRTFTADPEARKCCLSVIDGTLYATLCGVHTDIAGTWIYRDTSGTSGEGPWVLHSTVHQISTTSVSDFSLYGGHCHGSEIIKMASDRWVVCILYYGTGGSRGRADFGCVYSDDGGVNWNPGTYTIQGGLSFSTSTINGVPGVRAVALGSSTSSFGYVNGKLYVACGTNSGGESHWYSTNGATWTRYTVGTGGNFVYTFPFSVGNKGWRATSSETWGWTTGSPESSPTYNDDFSLGSYGMSTNRHPVRAAACNIGSTIQPLVVVTKLGRVLGLGQLSGGWTIDQIGIG